MGVLTKEQHRMLSSQALELLPEHLRQDPALSKFLDAINASYQSYDRELALAEERSIERQAELAQLNQRLQETADRFKLAAKAWKVGIWEWNASSGEITWDDFMYDICGIEDKVEYDKDKLNWYRLFHSEDVSRLTNAINDLPGHKNNLEVEFRIIRQSDKKIRHLQIVALVTRNAEGLPQRMVGVCMDITAERDTEREHTSLMKELIDKNRDLESFAFVVSHKLRAHSAKMMGISYVMKNEQAEEELKQYLVEELLKEAGFFDQSLRELTELITIKRNTQEAKKLVLFNKTMEDVLEALQEEIVQSGATIEYDFDKAERVYATESAIYNMLLSLVSNSLKFRSVDRRLLVSVNSFTDGRFVTIKVKDNGMGIDVERYGDKLFGLYRRFHSHIDGKGIGLHLVKTQVEILGGKIGVESALERETTFTINLPAINK
jgi:signal transduction histidine kinase